MMSIQSVANHMCIYYDVKKERAPDNSYKQFTHKI